MPLTLPSAGEALLLAAGSAVGTVSIKVASMQSEDFATFMMGVPLAAVFSAYLILAGSSPAEGRLVRVCEGFRLLLLYNLAAMAFVGVWLASVRPLASALGVPAGVVLGGAAASAIWALCAGVIAAGVL